MVICVVNESGTVSVDQKDGSWVCTAEAVGKHHHKHKSEQKRLSDPVSCFLYVHIILCNSAATSP